MSSNCTMLIKNCTMWGNVLHHINKCIAPYVAPYGAIWNKYKKGNWMKFWSSYNYQAIILFYLGIYSWVYGPAKNCVWHRMRNLSFDDFYKKVPISHWHYQKCNKSLVKYNYPTLSFLYLLRKLGIHMGFPNSCFMCHKFFMKDIRRNCIKKMIKKCNCKYSYYCRTTYNVSGFVQVK